MEHDLRRGRGQSGVDQLPVADIALDRTEARMLHRAWEKVDAGHVVALVEEPAEQQETKEPGPSGDENLCHEPMLLRSPAPKARDRTSSPVTKVLPTGFARSRARLVSRPKPASHSRQFIRTDCAASRDMTWAGSSASSRSPIIWSSRPMT